MNPNNLYGCFHRMEFEDLLFDTFLKNKINVRAIIGLSVKVST